ncbi:MAG: HEAT repeat domain-containing protein [Clostridiales bacterium]|nr:HEAT repeat domain-containing protein [Clostridiales bacterium]
MSEEKDISKIEKLTEKRRADKIEKYLDDKDFSVVKAAIQALGKIQDETSVNLLSKLIEDDNPEVRKVAIVAFASGNTEYAKTFLQHLIVTEKLEEVKEVARTAVHNMRIR